MRRNIVLFWFLLVSVAAPCGPGLASEPGWKTLFDGQTLEAWKAPDMGYWSVEDDAITGTVTADRLPPENVFIVWQGGEVRNFELKFKFRIFGAKANSGMQFRSEVKDRGLVHGYQADIAQKYVGGIWDEYGERGSLAACGQQAIIGRDGSKKLNRFAETADLQKDINLEEWNEYHITAKGPRIILRINGKITAGLDDYEQGKARSSGVLAMPVIAEPMKVQYKDIRLKALPDSN
ncbi:MAG: DUF1080 domain-containing protein [Acidobacteriota bacterium]